MTVTCNIIWLLLPAGRIAGCAAFAINCVFMLPGTMLTLLPWTAIGTAVNWPCVDTLTELPETIG